MARGVVYDSLAALVDYLQQEEEDRAVPISALADVLSSEGAVGQAVRGLNDLRRQAGQGMMGLGEDIEGSRSMQARGDLEEMATIPGHMLANTLQAGGYLTQFGADDWQDVKRAAGAVADKAVDPETWRERPGPLGESYPGLFYDAAEAVQPYLEKPYKVAQEMGVGEVLPGAGILAKLGMAVGPMGKKSLFDIDPRVTKKSLENPAVWRREALREKDATTVENQLPIERNVVQPEDLQGMVGVPFMGDRSRAGGQLTQVEGVPLSRPVELQGGEDYPLVTNPEAAWASNLGAARNRQNVAERVMEETGASPVGVFTVMGERGIDFSTPVIEAMMGQLDAIEVPKGAIEKFDRHINDKIETINKFNERPMQSFVGLNHPDAMAQILGVGDYPSVGAGELRKMLVQEMGMTEFRDIGFPVYHDVMKAVTKKELMPLQRGDAGTTMLRLDPEAPLSSESRHRTYTTAIPGGYLGGLEEAVPAKVMYPKGYDQMAGLKTKTGKPLSESDKIGWLQMAQHWEVFDQQWVDKVSEWLQKSGARKGGAAMVMAPLIFGAAQIEQLEQE